MLDLQALIDHVNAVAADPSDPRLPPEWSAHWAWTMNPVEAEDLPSAVPLVAFYQGREVFASRTGYPCSQTVQPSVIVAVIVCNKTEHAARLRELRSVLLGYQAQGDESHLPLYLSDEPGLPSEALDIKGDYLWWQDNWFTRYILI